MLGIKVICVGRLKEKFYIDAANEYCKRLAGYCKPEIIEVPEQRLPPAPSKAEIDAALEKECSSIESKLPKGAIVIALCVEGKQLESHEVSQMLSNHSGAGESRLSFIIGGSFGLHDRIKDRADIKLSLSKMTFPHNLARVVLLEQLYRGFKIIEGGKYHK